MRPPCARPDCPELARQGGYCPKHAALVRRRGVPYRRDETDEQQAGNSIQQDMDAALKADPPVIVWRSNGKRIQIAVSVIDNHAPRERSWV